MWRRGGNIRYDSSDGRYFAVVVLCAGRGVRGHVVFGFGVWSSLRFWPSC